MQAKGQRQADELLQSALGLQAVGAFAIVLEAIPEDVAGKVTAALEIPTIGIGAGEYCDGQVLVTHDILGLYPGRVPSFVKQYADLGNQMTAAVEDYLREVRDGVFPEDKVPSPDSSLSR